MNDIRFILKIAKLLWVWRKETDNNKFVMLMLSFLETSPLAKHAYDYLTWLETADSVTTKRTKGKITIEFDGDF